MAGTPDVMVCFCNIDPFVLHSTGVFAGLGPGAGYEDMAAYGRARLVDTAWNGLFGPVVATGLMANFVFRPGLYQMERLLGHAASLAWLMRMDLAGWYNVPAPPGYDRVAAVVAAGCKASTAGAGDLCQAIFAATFYNNAVDATECTTLKGAPLRLLTHIAKYTSAAAPPDLLTLGLLIRHLVITAPGIYNRPRALYISTGAPKHAGGTMTVFQYIGKTIVRAAGCGHAEAARALCAWFKYKHPAGRCPLTYKTMARCARRGYAETIEWATASGYYCDNHSGCPILSGRHHMLVCAIDACRPNGAPNTHLAVIERLLIVGPCRCGQEPSVSNPVIGLPSYIRVRWRALNEFEAPPYRLLLWAISVGDLPCLHLVRDGYMTAGYNYYTTDASGMPADAIRLACQTGRLDVLAWIYAAGRNSHADGCKAIQDGFMAACARGDMPIAFALADLGNVPYMSAFGAMRSAVIRGDATVATALIERYGVTPADARTLRCMYTMGASGGGSGGGGASPEA